MTKILIVDDSETLCAQLAELLRRAGYQVVVGVDGAAGVTLAQEHQDVGLIISDFNMPEMDGLTMLRRIQQLPGFTAKPTFMLTTEASAGLKAGGKELGVRAWIVKPFEPDKLLAVIKKVLGA